MTKVLQINRCKPSGLAQWLCTLFDMASFILELRDFLFLPGYENGGHSKHVGHCGNYSRCILLFNPYNNLMRYVSIHLYCADADTLLGEVNSSV